jgi:hypothetical protein
MNGQSRDTDNVGHKTQNKCKEPKKTTTVWKNTESRYTELTTKTDVTSGAREG